MKRHFILASGSPRRREMLTAAGLDFQVMPSPAEEIHDVSMPLHLLCEANAGLKALAVAADYPEHIVIGADTLVSVDGVALGKPGSQDEAREMLARLSGRVQQVCTGVCLARGESTRCFHAITEVVFKELSPEVIEDYMAKVDVMDKAGSYAVQEHGEMIIAELHGDYDNVVGLPLSMLLDELLVFEAGC